MEDRLNKALKPFKAIKPSADFMRYSRAEILATKQKFFSARRSWHWNFWSSVKFASSLTLATLLVLIVIGGLSYFNLNLAPTLLTELDKESLLREANSLDFQIHLKELKYYDDSAKEVAALLDQVTENETNL
ncbi:MAG: hypothetical protein Q8Q37_03050 [bacterium]|nr:hypothetical protein [bacterium]